MFDCCFAMKGVPLPKDLTFSDGLLTTLKRICRYYMERSQSVFIPSMGAKVKSIVPSQSPYKGAMVARKSEPHGSSVQLFSLLPTASVQTSNGNNVQKIARFDNGRPTTSARVSVVSGALDQKRSEDTSELSLLMREPLPQTTQVSTLGKVYMVKIGRTKNFKVTRSPRKTSTTRSQATGISSRAGLSAVSVNGIDKNTLSALRSPKAQSNSQNSKQLSARPVTPVSAAKRDTPVTTKASEANGHAHAQQASTSGLAGYQTLQTQILETERRLGHVEVDAQENKIKYDGLREEKKHSIDVLMKERHQAEIKLMLKQLEQKHKAERAAEKNEYDSLVEEYRAHKNMIESSASKQSSEGRQRNKSSNVREKVFRVRTC
ncbi:hypothetical protein N0V95_006527 [Ascochyta clinopodiicola]|nr:hypothetical protein N0V95_006527 [Ascochyta clinopodiicola]